jgi:hypothetical protein
VQQHLTQALGFLYGGLFHCGCKITQYYC